MPLRSFHFARSDYSDRPTGLFFMVRPAGRTYLEVKVLYSPDKGKNFLNGKGVAGDCESGGSRRNSAGLTNRKPIRGGVAVQGVQLRDWTSHFRLTEGKGVLQDLDGWIRHKLLGLLWRQCKYPATRNRRLQSCRLDAMRAWKSASNGRGPWWNAGASHMNRRMRNRKYGSVRGRRG